MQPQVTEQKGTGLRILGQVGWESLGISKSLSPEEWEKNNKRGHSKVLSRIQTRLRGLSRWNPPLLCHSIPNPSLQAESSCKGISIQRLGPNYVKFLVAINPDSSKQRNQPCQYRECPHSFLQSTCRLGHMAPSALPSTHHAVSLNFAKLPCLGALHWDVPLVGTSYNFCTKKAGAHKMTLISRKVWAVSNAH